MQHLPHNIQSITLPHAATLIAVERERERERTLY